MLQTDLLRRVGILAAAVMAGCGFLEPPAQDYIEAPVMTTRALEAELEERDDSGALLWKVRTQSMLDQGGIVECDSIRVEVFAAAAANSPVFRRLPGGMTATAESGVVERGTDTSRIMLSGGFRLRMENGWNVEGRSITWDGQYLTSKEPVTMTRAGVKVTGGSAVIEPATNRVSLRNVRGTIEGVGL